MYSRIKLMYDIIREFEIATGVPLDAATHNKLREEMSKKLQLYEHLRSQVPYGCDKLWHLLENDAGITLTIEHLGKTGYMEATLRLLFPDTDDGEDEVFARGSGRTVAETITDLNLNWIAKTEKQQVP